MNILIFFSALLFLIASSSSLCFVPASVTTRITPLSGMLFRVTSMPGGMVYIPGLYCKFIFQVLVPGLNSRFILQVDRTSKCLFLQILNTTIFELVEARSKFFDIVGLFQKINIRIVETGEHPGGDL